MNERYRAITCCHHSVYGKILELEEKQTGERWIGKLVYHSAPTAFLHQLKMESRVLETLHSRWIPTMKELCETEEGLLLIEEKMEGVPLREWLKTKPGRQEKRRLFLQVIELIQQVHQAGYVHMDIKGENIMVNDHHAVLIDFNATVPVGSRQALLTSPTTTPPEALAGEPLSFQADQTGLGNLHRLLFGSSWISWTCLQHNPKRRFHSLHDLRKACQNASRHRLIWSMGALVLCVALASLPVSAASWKQKEKNESDMIAESGSDFYQALAAQNLTVQQMRHNGTFEWAIELALEEDHIPLLQVLYGNLEPEDCSIHVLKLEMRCTRNLDKNRLEAYFCQLENKAFLSQELFELCELLLSVQELLPVKLLPAFQKLLNECQSFNSSQARGIVEYALLLKQACYSITLTEELEKSLKVTNEGQNLYRLWQRTEIEKAVSIPSEQ